MGETHDVSAVSPCHEGPGRSFGTDGCFERFREHLAQSDIDVADDTSRWLLMKCPRQHRVDPAIVARAAAQKGVSFGASKNQTLHHGHLQLKVGAHVLDVVCARATRVRALVLF